MADPETRARPFYCGSQAMDWKCNNCDTCTKGYDDGWRCDLEKSIDEAAMGDGSMSQEIAKRMGTPEDVRVHCWRCPEWIEDEALKNDRATLERKLVGSSQHADWIEDWAKERGIKLP